jgi:hypothetical protein
LGGTVAQYRDWGNMQDFTGLLIDIGDNPPGPYQLTIDNISMHLEDRKGNAVLQMKDFRIATPVFTALVPEAPYGTSVKDFLEEGPIPSGSYPAMVDGYFVMLKFTPGSYWVHSWASAGREPRGPYFSELLYQIEVATRPPCVPHGSITAIRPARNQAMFARIQKRKLDRGEFSPGEADKMAEYLGSMQELKYRVTLKSTKQVIISLKDKIGPKQTEELENLIPKPKDKIKPEQVDKFIKSAEELTESITRKDEAGIKQKIQGLKEIFKHER